MNPIGNTSALNWGALNGVNGIAVGAHTTPAPYATRVRPATHAIQASHPLQGAGFRMRYSRRNPAAIHAMMSMYQRNRIVPSKPQTSPTPPLRPTVRRRPPSVVAPALNAGWVRDLDLKSFDELDFLRECGEIIADSASLDLRLAAAHRCFAPQLLAQRSALSLEGLDSLSRPLFFSA